jgi:pseudouridine-5'-phosphate glycosidase
VNEIVSVAPEVADALRRRAPVVALETTLVAHGFPPGDGVEVALESERRVRAAGAVPATVGVLDEHVRIGLSTDELARFGPDARKVGARDLAACAIQGAVGATTIGGTLAACRVAGIGFMGTGGLGGVHRGFPHPADVSGDLAELARTEALVVCSGVKSLLDVEATIEALETLAVPVLGWRTDELPRFYSVDGPAISMRVESADEAARIARAHWQLGRRSALVLARPPDESLDVDELIETALADARAAGVRGQEVTPFVLSLLHERSGGETLRVNKEFVAANAGLAAEVAGAYSRLS